MTTAMTRPQPPMPAEGQYAPQMPPPGYVLPPPKKRFRGLAITALVLGIIGAVFALTPITFLVAFPLGALALVFGAIGFRHGLGKAGAILGAISLVLAIVWSAAWSNATSDGASNPANNQPGVSRGIGANDASGDVRLGQLKVENTFGSRDYYAQVTVTNNSSQRSDYWITVALESADGSRQIDTTDIFIQNLGPGQTRHEDSIFLSAENVPANAKLVLQEVQRTASN